MNQIKNLTHGQFMIGIAQGDLIGQTTLGQRVGKSGTHRAGANDHDLSWFPRVIIHKYSSVVVPTVFVNGNVSHWSELQLAIYHLACAMKNVQPMLVVGLNPIGC
jgi:hypothetical protein